ncbi:hypothetical protein X975_06677, partial [Stegodyphus mimosarum]
MLSDNSLISLGLYYEPPPTSSEQPSSDLKTPKPRQEFFSEKLSQSFTFQTPSNINTASPTSFKSPYLTSSTPSTLSQSFSSSLSGIFSSEGNSSMFYPTNSGQLQSSQEIMDSSEAGTAALVSSSVLNRTMTNVPGSSSSGLPTYGSYSSSSTVGTSIPFQLPSLDLYSDYTPGPLTIAVNVLSSSSSPSSNELSSFGLDILDSELRTPPVTSAISSLSSPFSMPTSVPSQQSHSFVPVMQDQTSSTNIFETGVPVTTTPSTTVSSMVQSDVWRPY